MDDERMTLLDLPQHQQHREGIAAAADLSFYVFADAVAQSTQPAQPAQLMHPGQHPLTQPGPPCGPHLAPGALAMDELGPQMHRHVGLMGTSGLALDTTAPATAHIAQHPFALGHAEPYACWSQDPMDLDYDPELASWVNSWGIPPPQHAAQDIQPLPLTVPPLPQQQQQQFQHHRQQEQQQLLQAQQQENEELEHRNRQEQQQQQQQQQLRELSQMQQQPQEEPFSHHPHPTSQDTGPIFGLGPLTVSYAADSVKSEGVLGPDDFLFPDDETAAAAEDPPLHELPAFQHTERLPSAPRQPGPGLDLNDPTTLHLYDQMLLFSRGGGPAGDKLLFKDCDSKQEAILCRLAEKLKLSYGYDPVQQQACVWGLSAVQATEQAQTTAGHVAVQTTAQALAQATTAQPESGQPVKQRAAQTPMQTPAPTPAQTPAQSMKQSLAPNFTVPAPAVSLLSSPNSSHSTKKQASVQPTASLAGNTVDSPIQGSSSSARSVPPSQPLPDPPPAATPRRSLAVTKENTQQKRHTAYSSPATFSLVQQNTNTAGLIVGLTPPPTTQVSCGPDGAGPSADPSLPATFSLSLSGHGFADEENDQDGPSLTDRLSSSWSIFHSGISSRRPRGRRGPLSAKSRKDIKNLEWAGGACWRCKILRRKCDPGAPCKNCPAPDLREDAPPWSLIGCRRGNLPDAMPPRVLCTKSRALLASCSHKLPAILAAENVVASLTGGGPPPCQPDAVSQCFREAEAQCLSDNKLVLDNPSLYLRARNNSVAAQHFSQSIRNGRYRANETLNTACDVHERAFSYSDLIAGIAWDLADNGECLAILEIESIESFMLLLETACLYEVEVGKSAMVGLALVCLRCCLDALRLHSSRLLDARLHSTCQGNRCSINCLRELAKCIDSYIEELSLLMFRKVNLRDRRWWLSTFYSLCIQAYVRRALLVIEQRLLFPDTDDVDALFSSQYLHLVTVLFIAVSFQYDPLATSNGGLRLQQALLAEEDGASTDLFVPDRYFSAGRAACAVDLWADDGIKSSYQFLTRLLNIGSLDFDMGQGEGGGGDVCMEGSDTSSLKPRRPPRGLKSGSFSGYSTPNSSTTSFTSSFSGSRSVGASGMMSPPSSCGPIPSSTSSPRTSLLLSERRSSIGSLPSRLSVASFPSFQSAGADLYSSRVPHSAKPAQLQATAAIHGAPGRVFSIVSEGGNTGSAATATAADTTNGNSSAHFVCTCCLKRPQRFDTLEALKSHQTKKPHICAFCGRRFSRMNEAERHITTIHLRPYSWSCRRLVNPLLAFQRMSDGKTAFDVCGFCGKQFPRDVISDVDQKTTITTVTAKHAAELTTHVRVDHRLHECKATTKKFYREDMFGQHLKLSHAAEPGVWLKYLENACKVEEKENMAALANKEPTETAECS